MASFEEIIPAMTGIFERHMPQLDTQDRERDNPHRAGPENLPPEDLLDLPAIAPYTLLPA